MKRKVTRTQNWSIEEKIALFNHVKTRINIIENRDPNPDTVQMKNRTWQNIHYELKSKRLSFREVLRLKEGWSRMKANARLEMRAFAQMLKKHGVHGSIEFRPSHLSIEVKRLVQSVKPYQCDSVKIKKEIDMSGYLLQILDSQVPPKPLDINSCQAKEEDPLAFIKVEDCIPEESPPQSYCIENARTCNEDVIESLNHKRRRPNDTDDCQEDNNEEIVSFAEVEYTKDESNKVEWSYDALNEEHKIKLQLLSIELEKAELQKQTALNEFKTSDIKLRLAEAQANDYQSKVRMSGERGSGAGQGGGGGGAIRNAGGSFGKMEAAHEDQYFYNQQKEQLKKIREELTDEISFHEEQIKRHEEAINRHKARIGDMENFRYLSEKNIDSNYDQFFNKNVAYESEYYYKQDKELLRILKQKTEEEVKIMQNKVRRMEDKIKEYNGDINETLRFLDNLNKDTAKKKEE